VTLAEELKESTAPFGCLLRARLIRRCVGKVDGDHVSDWNFGYVAFAPRGGVLAGDIVGERPLSFPTLAHAAASAVLASAVFDDPDCALGSLVLSLASRSEP
jgi:hypothetical protein